MRISHFVIGLVFVAACGGTKAPPAPKYTAAQIDSLSKDSIKKITDSIAHRNDPKNRHAQFDTSAAKGERPMVRETYRYEGGGADPFKAIAMQVVHGPELAELKLVSIGFVRGNPLQSFATFRDIGNNQRYVFQNGQRYGSIFVVSITDLDVKLRQEEFGSSKDQVYTMRKTENDK